MEMPECWKTAKQYADDRNKVYLDLLREAMEALEWYEAKEKKNVSKIAWESSISRAKFVLNKFRGLK